MHNTTSCPRCLDLFARLLWQNLTNRNNEFVDEVITPVAPAPRFFLRTCDFTLIRNSNEQFRNVPQTHTNPIHNHTQTIVAGKSQNVNMYVSLSLSLSHTLSNVHFSRLGGNKVSGNVLEDAVGLVTHPPNFNVIKLVLLLVVDVVQNVCELRNSLSARDVCEV